MFTPSSKEEISCPLITFGLWMKTRHFDSFCCGYADHHQSHLWDSNHEHMGSAATKKKGPPKPPVNTVAPRRVPEILTLQQLCDIWLDAGWAILKNLFSSFKKWQVWAKVKNTDLLYVSRLSKNLGWKKLPPWVFFPRIHYFTTEKPES